MAKSISQSFRQYARGIAGGLLFSLPLLYTMEVWWAGFIASPLRLIIYMLVSFLLLLGYNSYAGIRQDHTFADVISESVEEMGLGLLIAGIVLWLIGRITAEMGYSEILGKIIVEAMTVAIGISVGKAQLGGEGSDAGEQQEDTRQPHFQGQVLVAMCGAVLIASNVAPTEEIVMIAVEITALKLILLAIISIIIGTGVLYYSNFRGADHWVRKPDDLYDVLAGALIMYAVALGVSAFMLWFFGRFNGNAIFTIIAETIVLAFPASLGASAGRLLIQA